MPGRDLPLAGGTYSRRCRPGTLLLCKASLVFILMDSASNALAQKIREDLYVTDGPVYATALSGNVLYIGGYFSRVGPATGSGVPVDKSTGVPTSGFPKVAGTVLAVAPDGVGGWFIGGSFAAVGGFPRSNVAHILADNMVASWDPGANGAVHAIAVTASRVYVGGEFTSIGGQPRN